MKSVRNPILFIALAGVFFAACSKVDGLPFYGRGAAPVLTASTLAVAPAPADSNNTALTLNWSYPAYATDSANIKYVVQMDTAGGNFSNAVTKEVLGDSTVSFTAKELNTIALAYGGAFGVAKNLLVRVLSSYANNNEQYNSNTLTVTVTPYKIPPKVSLPTSGKLFIVGDATKGGWNNPVPTPSQELAQINETTYGGIFYMTGGKEYLILPVNGDWGAKYSVANKSTAGLAEGGEFGFNLADNFPGPAADGWYKIMLDFQTGKFTVTKFEQQHGLPDDLFAVGDATPGGWNNPVPVPAQQLTRINSAQFELTLALNGGKKFLLLPTNGDWGKKFGADKVSDDKLSGTFKPEGSDIDSPADGGTYKIKVDFLTGTYTLTKQ